MAEVSIIMGTYNGAASIGKAIESIINQTFKDWEFIICDDGSTDNTIDVVNEYIKRDGRISLIKNEVNQGLAVSLNKCLAMCSGKYIARMDDDDVSHADRIEKELFFLTNNPNYHIVSTGRYLFDDNGVWGKDDRSGEVTSLDVFKGNFFVHPTVLIRKEAYDIVDGYSEDKAIGREEDTDLWCKMYASGLKGYILGDILFDYYESRESMKRRKYKFRVIEYKLKKKYRKKLGIPFKYFFYEIKPLLVGLVPNFIIRRRHKRLFNYNESTK